MNLVQCYSKGDRRFSALYAMLLTGHTIEWHYQHAKRDANMKPFTMPEWNPGYGMNPTYLYLNKQMVPNTRELQWSFYTMLWSIYFDENPELFFFAVDQDGFYEREGSTIYYPNNFEKLPYHKRIDQAASIAFLVWTANQFPCLDEVVASRERYDSIYHPIVHI